MAEEKMKEYPNFYENFDEAHSRLRGTVVMYDGLPYFVWAITKHKANGIFRIYLEPCGRPPGVKVLLPDFNAYGHKSGDLGPYLDSWMESNPKGGIIRKEMNSPKFDKYRPFPLGMCNYGTNTFYLERTPNRSMPQGLTKTMLSETIITCSSGKRKGPHGIDMMQEAFRDCVLEQHPSAQECLTNLLDDKVTNEAAAFNRYFAFCRGPMDMIFLAYKEDIVGVLPKNDFNHLRIGQKFKYTKEVIESLHLFQNLIF